jgi:hypothetical protein
LDDAQRRDVAVQVLKQVPVLWVWDNVEPVAGFPEGSESVWSSEEQQELRGFLAELRQTKASVLLTSRRQERAWLGELPAQVELPPMPMAERVRLARAVAAKYGRRLAEVEDWRPLLDYTQGNPLTVAVLVGQALRDNLRTRAQVEGFVDRLQAGEQRLADDDREERTRSLGASLGYGFAHAFNDAERAQLALLHLFQGVVDVDALTMMGNPKLVDQPVAAAAGLDRERGIGLLDRAAEVGLLTTYGGGYYGIHPALPWYFNRLFTEVYGSARSPTAEQASHAYTTAISELGSYYHNEYNQGRRGVVSTVRLEEPNLLQARRLARTHGWWDQVIAAMQGLRMLYEHTGRNVEWARLVDELVPDLVDPATGGPRSGREDLWSLVTEYREALAVQRRDYAAAEGLLRARVAWNQERAAAALAIPPEELNGNQRDRIHSLAVSLHELGQVLRQQKRPACVDAYREALGLVERLGNRPYEAVAAFNLGNAYLGVPELRDLDEAERWYQYSLDRRDEKDYLGRSNSINELGLLHYERFKEAQASNRHTAELLAHLNASASAYQEALDLTPADAVGQLAVTHHQLGLVYSRGNKVDTAVRHWQESIRLEERQGNRYGAAQTRNIVAITLAENGRLEEALLWAQAALRDLESYGERVADQRAQAQRLITVIEQALAGKLG